MDTKGITMTTRSRRGVPGTTVGIDMGGTMIRGGLVGPDGSLRGVVRRPLPDSPEARHAAVLELARDLGQDASAVGVAVAGVIDDGRLLLSANVGLGDIDLRADLVESTGLPSEVINDAQAAALAEVHGSSAQGLVLVVTVGTGIGGAVVLDGKLVRGRGFAGEIGHVVVDRGGLSCGCGAAGCWEGLASGEALRRAAERVLPGPDRTVDRLVAAADSGEPTAVGALMEAAEAFADGLDGMCAVLAPHRIVLGGGVFARGGLVADVYRSQAATRRWVRGAEITMAVRGDHAGLLGAGLAARELVAGPPTGILATL
ncbi:ROK family protein [Isoptericola sp. NPDC057391]|uniref:ROK family protein n=1 Tax=Isoptericola sp. NPDC057391 TaxID=3346117 RepID=UPI00363559BF